MFECSTEAADPELAGEALAEGLIAREVVRKDLGGYLALGEGLRGQLGIAHPAARD
jgi:hypothetical protein